MDKTFNKASFRTSRVFTNTYSTSFSIGARCLRPSVRNAIYSIYGFVRLADEIVDSFHGYDRESLLEEFTSQYYRALNDGISINPVINSFRDTVIKYNIRDDLVRSFLSSMRSDLYKSHFEVDEIGEYIYGSAEVVGLMCLKVFVGGNEDEYNRLKPYAMRLGAAFQKINFLRDLRHDINNLHRLYFPVLNDKPLDETTKRVIIDEIYDDYAIALKGIKLLPASSRLGVYTAYLYYRSLTKLIEAASPENLMHTRVRVSNARKMLLLGKALLTVKFI